MRRLRRSERMFYDRSMRVEYREEECRSALNRVKGMPFSWSLNPYTGCAHRCTFCYVRAFERRADRPADDRYGRSIRVKVNVAEVLARELTRRSWQRETVAIGAATDPYQPAEGRYRLTRACIEVLGRAASPFGLITRGPLIVRDVDVLQEAARRGDRCLGEPALPRPRHEGALPRGTCTRLARAAPAVRGAVCPRRLSAARRGRAGPPAGAGSGPDTRRPRPPPRPARAATGA